MNDLAYRREIVDAAMGWIGTPYQHQASVKGQGSDCLGLVRGVWRQVVGAEPESRPTYSADWGQTSGDDLLMSALETHFHTAEICPLRFGDVIAFRLRKNGLVKHVGIVAGDVNGRAQMIHSYSNHGVVLGPIGVSWLRRCAGQFQFPRRENEWQRFY